MELPAHFSAPLCPIPDQELKEGGEAWLECVISPPNAKVTWFKNGEEVCKAKNNGCQYKNYDIGNYQTRNS